VSDPVDRQVSLPAEESAPTTARDVVVQAVMSAGLSHLAHETALLTAELVRLSVLHTGAAQTLRVIADTEEVTVRISDPIRQADPMDAAETKRVVALIDSLATSWGTEYSQAGKSFWFRVTKGPGALLPPVTLQASDAPETKWAERRAQSSHQQLARWLTFLPEHVRRLLNTQQALEELVRRLCEILDAQSAVLWIDEGGEPGPQPVAWCGLPEAPTSATLARQVPAGNSPVSAPASVARAVLEQAGARHTAGVGLALSTPLRGGLDLGFSGVEDLGEETATLAMLSAERMALIIDADRARETEVRRRGFLVFLAEASELLANSLDVDLTMMLVAQLCVTRLGEWCAIHTPGPHGRPDLAIAVHVDEREIPSLQKRFAGGPGDPADQRLREVIQSGAVRSMPEELTGIAVPLTARRQVVGTMTIGAPPGRRHTAEEIAIAEDLGRRAGLALLNARLFQERATVAAALQKGLLPGSLPTAQGVEFGAEYVPSGDGNQVGGDFYDVIELPGGEWMLAIGDVCGKGPEAASVTGVVRDVIRVLVREGRPLTYVLTVLNATLLEQRSRTGFCTVAAATARRDGELIRLELVLAGHLLPAVVRADGSASFVGETGMAVGVFDEIEVTAVEVVLHPGEAIVFYTDGVTERREGEEFFGENTLLETLTGNSHLSGPRLAALLQTTVTDFGTEPPRDDIAVLVLRNQP
jgi:sigma-B regulation protein RsbU (phosphoserine phosphatase)